MNDMEEEAYDSNDKTLDTKSGNSSKSRSCKDTLFELEVKMERYKKPPFERDLEYFVKVGLPGVDVNPHKLKVDKDVANEILLEIFKKVTP
jgi:hypothetical protein